MTEIFPSHALKYLKDTFGSRLIINRSSSTSQIKLPEKEKQERQTSERDKLKIS